MAGYTKLFSSIVTSTIWRERDHVRLVWVTMLAMSDQHGVIESSVPGLADMARVSRELCDDALGVLSNPDPDSRTKDHDGRRIMAVDGGWRLINHGKYREKMSLDEKRNRNAAYMRDYRSRNESVRDCKAIVNECNSTSSPVSRVEHTEAEANTDQIRSDSSEPPSACSEPAVLVLPCAGKTKKTFNLTQSMIEAWADAWPGIDILAEAKKAKVWLEVNPHRQKTHRGVPAFLTNWCSNAQDRHGGKNVAPGASGSVWRPSQKPAPVQTDIERELAEKRRAGPLSVKYEMG